MGIEGFYRTLEKKNDKEIGIIKNFNKNTDTNFFYIDFNSILYNISLTVDSDLGYILAFIIYDKNNKSEDENLRDIAKKWNYNLETASIDTYVSYFTESLIEKFMIQLVKEYLMKLFKTFISSNSLRKIFISADGIPNMAKIIEQKQRKYMMYVRNALVKKIFNKYQNNNNKNKNISKERILFEETRIRFDRGKIVPWSIFMKNLELALTDKIWVNEIKENFPKLEEFILSGSTYPGEGEKKILEVAINDINNNTNNNSYMLYSPDADIILLSIILQNINYIKNNKFMNNFYVLHYDQESKTNSFINIEKFSKYISTFITTNKENDSELIFNIMNDFVIISTVFGNDFVPKISSINVKTDFSYILELYKNMFNKKNNILENIVLSPTTIHGKFQINYKNLLKYMKYVADIEDDLIREKYLIDHYNTNAIKKILNLPDMTEREIFNFIKTYIDEYGRFVKTLITNKNTNNNTNNNIIDKYDKNFLKNLVSLEIKKHNLQENLKDNVFEIVQNVLHNYNKNGRISKPLMAIRKNKNGTLQEFHIKKYEEDPINRLIIEKENGLSDYDRDIILLDWKLDDYAIMLNSLIVDNEDLNFGQISLDYKKFKLYMPDIDRDYYYQSYLGIDPDDLKYKNYILREYLFGLIWTFDFYFNKNDPAYNLSHVSTWFYPLHKAPLLKEIVQSLNYFINKRKMDTFTNKINANLTSRSKFLNRYEQLLYTVPKNRIKLVIDGYQPLLNNSSLFPDMDDYVNKIWNIDTSDQYIDCRRITFITKCILKKVKNYSFEEFMNKVRFYRKYLDPLLFNDVAENITISYNSNNSNNLTGGYDNILQLLKYYKNTYKKLYLDTKHKNYKYIYKEAKKYLNNI